MRKPIIGIIPTEYLFQSENPYDDYYKFINNYGKRVIEAGGIPYGILLDDGKINKDMLELCDAFIIPGGNQIKHYVYEMIFYAIMKNKPVLGICMGAEALAIFSCIYEKLDSTKKYDQKDLVEIYCKLKEQYEGSLLRRLEEPNIHNNGYEADLSKVSHPISLVKNSLVRNIYQKEEVSGVSFHAYDFKHVGKPFQVTGLAPDQVSEVIEFKDPDYFILGTHYHIELEPNNPIFQRLIQECQKRINKE